MIGWRTTPPGTHLWNLADSLAPASRKQQDTLYAFYDLAVSPATYDIVAFLVLAELRRREVRCTQVHVVIVPGPNEGFRDDVTPYDAGDKQWRLRQILVPCCWLVPSCRQVTVCTSRDEARALQVAVARHVFPRGYTVRCPIEKYYFSHIVEATNGGAILPSIEATAQARRFIGDWIARWADGRKLVTITLRESSYQQTRNSSMKEWAAFVRGLDRSKYLPVVIRDIERAFEGHPPGFDGAALFNEVVWNVELRAALYESSFLNLMVNNGPALLCLLNGKCRYIMFKLAPGCGAASEHFWRNVGIEPGRQLPMATKFQRIVWEDDTFETIRRAFADMSAEIERSEGAVPVFPATG